MGSPSANIHTFGVEATGGAGADITVGLPFTPRVVDLYVDGGAAFEHAHKTDMMSGSNHMSTTGGYVAGLTIGDKEITIAAAAPINNVAAGTIIYGIAVG